MACDDCGSEYCDGEKCSESEQVHKRRAGSRRGTSTTWSKPNDEDEADEEPA